MNNAPASQVSQQDANFENFKELCWRIHLRDGGTPRESMETAVKMMAETFSQMIAERTRGDA